MEIPLNICEQEYDQLTINKWQHIWETICKMSYEGTDICESIITYPGDLIINNENTYNNHEISHTNQYSQIDPININLLTLDHMWKQYSARYPTIELKIVPEFKKLVVPYPLYESLGITPWFRYSFPNCEVVYWQY